MFSSIFSKHRIKVSSSSTHKPLQKIVAGFTIIEVALTLGALGIASGLAIPMFRRYVVRNDVEIARQNISQALERAKFLSQVGMNDSQWGFSTDAIPGRGVLFMGRTFAERDPAFDELYTLNPSLTVSGITEVSFERITGVPTTVGDIIIRSPDNDEVKVTVSVGSDGQVDIPEDWLEICINPDTDNKQSIRVPDSLWETYQAEGALMGNCSQTVVITSSSVSSSLSSSSVSSGASSSSVSSGASSSSSTTFTIINDTVRPSIAYNYTAQVIGTALTIGSGYNAPVTVRFKEGSGPFREPWGDFTKPVDGNVDKPGTYTFTSGTIAALTDLDIWARSYYKKSNWYDGTANNHFNMQMQVRTDNETTLVHALKNGDNVPTYPGAGSQPPVETFLIPYTNPTTHKIQLGANQVIYLFELWTTNLSSSAADFQDLIILVTLNPA